MNNEHEKGRVLTVVVPAYNEEASIAETIKSLKECSDDFASRNIELRVYIVDDGSKDNTYTAAIGAGADKVVRHKKNRGLGAAVRTGLKQAHDDGSDVTVKFDADLQHDPEDIVKLIQPIVDDSADIVYGHRFANIQYRMPLVRKLGNLLFLKLMRLLTGWDLKDSQPGIFAVNRDYTRNIYMPGDYNYTQQILLDAYHKGLRFQHVDVTFKKRVTGKSFVSFKYPLKVLPQIVMVLVGVRPLMLFGSVGLAFLMAGIMGFVYEFIQFLTGFSDKPVVHVNAILGMTLFGVQTLFFGLIAHLVVELDKRRNG